MDVPMMYYVGLISNLIFLLLNLFGYIYIHRKTGRTFSFILLFAAAWLLSAVSYIFLVAGVSNNEWFITALRIAGYAFFLGTAISLIFELSTKKS